jgi:Protein of unknown function (DUF3485)
MLNRLAILLTPLLLLGLYLEQRTFTKPEDAAPYHAAVRAAVEAIPFRVGGWEGTTVKVPEPAQKLLRPNAILARQYRHRGSGRTASLILVQCGDTRDLVGHYPPVCYPGQGWVLREQEEVPVDTGETAGPASKEPRGPLPMRRYSFTRASFSQESSQIVYSSFIIPGRRPVPDMNAVHAAASDYQARSFGAAQIQVVLSEQIAREEERLIVSELLGSAAAAISAIERGRDEREGRQEVVR